MKRSIISSLLIVLSILLIAGCSKTNEVHKKNNNKEKSNGSSVVLYFSATGNTKSIAKKVAKVSNSDIIEIIPKEEYKSEDLDYNNDCRANREQNDSKARPEIKNKIDISSYDTIYLGYPIWWGTNPKIILTLLDTYDFTNKTIIPFCTSGSSDISNSVEELRKYNSKLDIKDGKRFSTSDSNNEIKEFVDQYTDNNSKEVTNLMKVIIDGKNYIINLEDNETSKSFVDLVSGSFTMEELNGNEKYVYLDKSLPTNSSNPQRINVGDVMLYGNNCLVIFYKSFETSYSYTKIGHIDNLPDLGNKSVEVSFKK